MKIGILGGTFNPIHIGHLAIAEFVREKIALSKIIFVPSYLPPHKSTQNVAPAKDRYQMTRLAIESNPHFEISDFEIKQKATSYTFETLKYLKELYPLKTQFFFLIGEDNLHTLHTWKHVEKLYKMAQFVAVTRPKVKAAHKNNHVRFVEMPGLEVSSSYIRKMIAQKHSVKYLLPDAVLKYIKKRHLYR